MADSVARCRTVRRCEASSADHRAGPAAPWHRRCDGYGQTMAVRCGNGGRFGRSTGDIIVV